MLVGGLDQGLWQTTIKSGLGEFSEYNKVWTGLLTILFFILSFLSPFLLFFLFHSFLHSFLSSFFRSFLCFLPLFINNYWLSSKRNSSVIYSFLWSFPPTYGPSSVFLLTRFWTFCLVKMIAVCHWQRLIVQTWLLPDLHYFCHISDWSTIKTTWSTCPDGHDSLFALAVA